MKLKFVLVIVASILLGLVFVDHGTASYVASLAVTPNYTRTEKWIVANSGSNFLITAPDGSTSTVAKAAAVTQSVVVSVLPAGSLVTGCVSKTNTAFTGTTTLAATVGITGSLTSCIATPYDLKAAVTATNLSSVGLAAPVVSTAGTNLIVAMTSTIDNLSSVSAGSVSIWVTRSVLP